MQHDPGAACVPPQSGTATSPPSSRATDPQLRRPPRPGREAGPTLRRRTAGGRASASRVWGPNSIEWAIAALAVDLRRRHPRARSTPATSAHEVADLVDRTGARSWSWSHDGFLGRNQIQDLRAASDLADVLDARLVRRSRRCTAARSGRVRADGTADEAEARAPTRLPRRRRRHPLHLRHHRPLQGRDERAPADASASRGPGPSSAASRAGRPLPGGQPVLPLVRLQDRHRRRPADRRDALPGRDVRPRRDDARSSSRERITVLPGAPTIYQSLLDAPGRGRARPLVAAARGHRRGRRTRRADRADARRARPSTTSSPRSA